MLIRTEAAVDIGDVLDLARSGEGDTCVPDSRRTDGDHARSYPDAPDFEPHITLLGGIETDEATAIERTRELVRGCDPFELGFTGVSCSTTTHQCVFLFVTPSAALLRLRRAASESFERD